MASFCCAVEQFDGCGFTHHTSGYKLGMNSKANQSLARECAGMHWIMTTLKHGNPVVSTPNLGIKRPTL
jgi:hypothetical protein